METTTKKPHDLWPRATAAAPAAEPAIHNGTYTIENAAKGGHRTFRIRTQKPDAKFAPGERVLALLTGPDNTSDFSGFAFVKADRILIWNKKKTPHNEIYANMLWSLATKGEASLWFAKGYRLHVEKRCLRCNRKLTHPESLRSGYGPECAGRE